jgi:dUTP pyrophosphatase
MESLTNVRLLPVSVEIYTDGVQLPEYASVGAAGCDIRAKLDEKLFINPGCRELIPTGIYLGIPKGWEVQIRPRSGLAFREGVHAILGTIDSDYRGEIKVLLMNNSNVYFTVEPRMRIAQMVCNQVPRMKWRQVTKEELSSTERGEGGFGSTGTQ